MAPRTAALWVAILVVMAFPTSAFGQAQTFGSPLTQVPNTFGCETEPSLGPRIANGDYDFLPSGDPGCTWFAAGVPGALNDPRTGSVPGDGTITSVSVRSGPTPAPLSFVVIRQLAQPGTGSACCFFVSETQPVQPVPNSISTFVVNIPVERNTNPQTGIVTGDYIGVSGRGQGMLPLFGNGRHNLLANNTGNPQAGFFYPRFGSQPNDSGGGRHEGGAPGFEVLLQATWCPAGQSCTGQPGGGGGGGGGGGAANTPTAGGDNLTGTADPDRICGLLGNDVINGLAGADTIFGDLCDDRRKVTAAQGETDGDDTLAGGDGNDTIYGAGGRDAIDGGPGNDKLFGGDGNDKLTGGDGNDSLTGGAGVNKYSAGAGKDKVSARNKKRETIDCGKGKDTATVDKKDKVRGCEKVKRR